MPPRQQQQEDAAGTKFVVFQDFSGGMDTQAARQGLPENKAAWMENLQPIAPNFLLGVPSPAAALAQLTGETVVKIFPGLIGTQDYLIAFTAAGAGYAITANGQGNGAPASGGVVTKFAPATTFSATGPDATTLNGQRILIADSKAGYSTWENSIVSVFVMQGGVSPNFSITNGGSGYTSGVIIGISGGSGGGASALGTVTNGVLTAITLTSAGSGYKAGDTLTVTVTAVGAGAGATANAHVWPFVSPAATSVAVAFGRVWLSSGRTLTVTGIGSASFGAGFDDFAAADGSVTTTISDADLVHSITCLRFLENFLYIIGDNSVKAIGSITLSASTTLFTITTLSSDQGTLYPQTVISFDRLVTFTNTVGVFAVFGTSVQKISDAMDGVFRRADFTVPPQAAVNDINNIHTLLVMLRYKDPTLSTRTLLLSFSNKRWFVTSQGNSVVALSSIVLGGITETFVSSGADITQILQGQSALAYTLITALSPAGNPIRDKRIVAAGIIEQVGGLSDLQLVIESENNSANVALSAQASPLLIANNSGGTMIFANNSGGILTFGGTGVALSHSSRANATGRYIGATVTGTLNGIAIQGIFIEYAEGALWGRG